MQAARSRAGGGRAFLARALRGHVGHVLGAEDACRRAAKAVSAVRGGDVRAGKRAPPAIELWFVLYARALAGRAGES